MTSSSGIVATATQRTQIERCLAATKLRTDPPATSTSEATSTSIKTLEMCGNIQDTQRTWITSDATCDSLFIRSCYETLYVLAIEFTACTYDRSHAITTGSHGIGKRCFLRYLIYRLGRWETPPVIVLDLPHLFCLIDSDGTVTIGVRGTSFQCELHDESTFYLCDASDPGRLPIFDGYVQARSVIVAAPVEEQLALIEKHRSSRRLVMPSWSALELAACRQASYPHVTPLELHQRQEMWGSFVKWTLGVTLRESVTQFQRSVAMLTLEKVVTLASNHGYATTASELHESHYLIDMLVDSDETFECRDAALCSYATSMRLMDAEPCSDHLIAFMEKHRYSYRLKTVMAQLEQQLLRRLMAY